MENLDEMISFVTLPVTMKSKIMEFVPKDDLKKARLVCTQWYRLLSTVQPPGFELLEHNPELLDILKKTFHHTVSKFKIGYYTLPLPIYSFNRFEIPRTHKLVLSQGISADNIGKLLRTYAKSCKQLTLGFRCFGKLPSYRLKGILRYELLQCLKIKYYIRFGFVAAGFKEHNHLIVLRQFLESVRLPSLQKLVISSGGIHNSALQSFNRFSQAMELFLERHGRQITALNCRVVPLRLVKSFKHLYNLEALELSLSCQFNEPIHNDVLDSLKYVKKLKSLVFSDFRETPAFHYTVIATLLNENKNCLKKLNFTLIHARADWMPINSTTKLEKLDIKFRGFSQTNFFNEAMILGRKLESVRQLDLLIESGPRNFDDQIIPWIINAFPNLEELKVYSPTRINATNRRLLIFGLYNLMKIYNEHTRHVLLDDDGIFQAFNGTTYTDIDGMLEITNQDPHHIDITLGR